MVIAADWPSRRPSVAAQEMSGWWSLTSTTKADSARLCSAGAQRHRGWKKAQRWKQSTGGVGKYFTLNITAVYKRCSPVRSRKHIRGLPKVPRLFRVSFPHVSTPSDQQVRAKRHHNRSGRRFGTISGATCISMSRSTSSPPSRSFLAFTSGVKSVGQSIFKSME